MKTLFEFKDESGLKVILNEEENGKLAFKTYYNSIPVNISSYDFNREFLVGLNKAISTYLKKTK